MDITDAEKIDQMGALINQRFGRLDILVGNAGILGILSPLGHIDPKIWDQVIAVNLTANWRLLRAMDPLLHSSDAGRAIFVTSTVGAEADCLLGGLRRLQGGFGNDDAHLRQGDSDDANSGQSG